METVKIPVDVVGLREKLSKLTLDELKEEYTVLGIASAWKNGVNKAIAVDKAISLFVKIQETEIGEGPIEQTIPFGEFDVDQDLLDELPQLSVEGFNIGDVLVHEEGKPFYKKEVVPAITEELETEKVETITGYVPEVIDETRFSEEELESNINICVANCSQALPDTRIALLRKIEALQLALIRKRE